MKLEDEVPTGFEYVGRGEGITTISGELVDVADVYRSAEDVLLPRGGSLADSSLHVEEFVFRGRKHRHDGPAVRVFKHPLDDEPYYREEWWLDGMRHRSGGAPAKTYISDGLWRRDEWWVRNRPSRLDGPAWHLVSYRLGEEEAKWAVRDQWGEGERFAANLAALAPATLRDEIIHSVFVDSYRADPEQTTTALLAGIRTVEGMREVLAGAPLDWVLAFEGSALPKSLGR